MATKSKPEGNQHPYGLYFPKKGASWVYDFRYPERTGERYSKSTRTADLKEAIKIAARDYAQAKQDYERLGSQPQGLPEIRIREAFARFYREKGSTYAAPKETLSKLANTARELGPDLYLSEITPARLLDLQTTLRARKLANRTVNAYVVDLMRAVFKQARKWGVKVGDVGSPSFDWSDLKMVNAAHRTRTASRREQVLMLRNLRRDYRPIIRFALMTGLRRAALLIKVNQIDWDNRIIFYQKKSRKTNDVGILPMTDKICALLKREIEKGQGSEWVFTYEAQRGEVDRKPITVSGLVGQMKKAVAKAGLEDWRLIHDLRHTAATETLRSSRNLVAVQMMLGHSDISMTTRYTNFLTQDVLAAMESRVSMKTPMNGNSMKGNEEKTE